MLRKILLATLMLAILSACSRPPAENPSAFANRIANEVLAGEDRMWHKITGSAFVWTACRKGRVVVLVVEGDKYKLLDLLEQAVCGSPMDQMAAATLRLKNNQPNLAADLQLNPDWLLWAAERSRLKH